MRGCSHLVGAMTLLLLAEAAPALAQRPHVRRYTLGDGLPHNSLTAVVQDRKGYVWVATAEGLARFDGYRFATYGTADGLGHSYVNAIAEDPHGHLWVATSSGMARLVAPDVDQPGGNQPPRVRGVRPAAFVSIRVGPSAASNVVNGFGFDSSGRLWCATNEGLFRGRGTTDDPAPFDPVAPFGRQGFMQGLTDSRGRLWFLSGAGAIVRVEGDIVRHQGATLDRDAALSRDGTGRVWLANRHGVVEFVEPSARSDFGTWRRLPTDLPRGHVAYAVAVDAHGTMWLTTSHGLVEWRGGLQTTYSSAHGLGADLNRVLTVDQSGHLWLGSRTSGLYFLGGDAIVNYTADDGLPRGGVASVFEGPDGRVFARGRDTDLVEILPDRVVPLRGTARLYEGMASTRRLGIAAHGTWWLLRPEGVCRIDEAVLRQPRTAVCTGSESVTPPAIVHSSDTMDIPDVYVDPAGAAWFATRDALHRIAPGSSRAERMPLVFPRPTLGVGPVFVDARGALWLMSATEIARWANGSIDFLAPGDGLPQIHPRSVLLDQKGRLWIGMRYSGVSMTTDPAAIRPAFVNYSTRAGLSSDTVWSIAEDEFGRIYFGTGRGVDRLDPATGHIQHLTTADGLAGDLINQCLTDRNGYVWVATSTGLSRLNPRVDRAPFDPPATYLTRIEVAGEEITLPETGTPLLRLPKMPSSASHLVLDYVAPAFGGVQALRYQYRLDGVDRDWSTATTQRSLTYARLAPGTYRFAVRAVTADGTAGPPALFEFEILPVFYRRTWFVAVVLCGMATLALAAHQLRVRRLLVMERIRRQIAADLHDDVGAGLAQVAILSEVARRDAPGPAGAMLAQIAGLARSMRDSMSDIVWSIDPGHDRLGDLVIRMRQAALSSLAGGDVHVEFHAPADPAARVHLAPDRRRQLLLIFKEAVTNVARHAGATHVRIALRVENRRFHLCVQDDGRGFDPDLAGGGMGLRSLRDRTAALGGDLRLHSERGRGTTVELDVPV